MEVSKSRAVSRYARGIKMKAVHLDEAAIRKMEAGKWSFRGGRAAEIEDLNLAQGGLEEGSRRPLLLSIDILPFV